MAVFHQLKNMVVNIGLESSQNRIKQSIVNDFVKYAIQKNAVSPIMNPIFKTPKFSTV